MLWTAIVSFVSREAMSTTYPNNLLDFSSFIVLKNWRLWNVCLQLFIYVPQTALSQSVSFQALLMYDLPPIQSVVFLCHSLWWFLGPLQNIAPENVNFKIYKKCMEAQQS